jgi:hypothetical protein
MAPAKTCWYCERRPEASGRAHRIPLQRKSAPAVLAVDLDVPRCRACARAHGRELFVAVLFFLVGSLIGIACYLTVTETLARAIGLEIVVRALAIAFGVVGGVAGLLVGWPLARLARGRCRSVDDPPQLAMMLADGWSRRPTRRR